MGVSRPHENGGDDDRPPDRVACRCSGPRGRYRDCSRAVSRSVFRWRGDQGDGARAWDADCPGRATRAAAASEVSWPTERPFAGSRGAHIRPVLPNCLILRPFPHWPDDRTAKQRSACASPLSPTGSHASRHHHRARRKSHVLFMFHSLSSVRACPTAPPVTIPHCAKTRT